MFAASLPAMRHDGAPRTGHHPLPLLIMPRQSLYRGALCAALPVALTGLLSSQALAQTVFKACFVPLSGTVYRVGFPNAPAQCLQPSHVAFQWTDGADAYASLQSALKNTDQAGGDVTGLFANLTVGKLLGRALATTAPSDGQALVWNAALNVWEPKTIAAGGAGGVTDHGALTGLADDDHQQYLLTNGVRPSPNGFAVTSTNGAAEPVLSGPVSGSALLWHGNKGALWFGAFPDGAPAGSTIGTNSFRFGNNTSASGANAFAGGSGSVASGASAMAMGDGAAASFSNTVALGADARATNFNAFALGSSARASGNGAFAFRGTASGQGAVAFLSSAVASGSNAFAFGTNALASGLLSIAWGGLSQATGSGAIAIGPNQTKASGDNAIALGSFAQATAQNAYAFGYGARATGAGAVAIGNEIFSGPLASGGGSIALGDGANTNNFSAAMVVVTDGIALNASAANQYSARFTGGFRLFTNQANTTGCSIAAGGGQWSCTSDSTTKTAITHVDGEQVLAKLRTMPVSSWEYRTERGARHIGPMAQDFHTAFGLGSSDKAIAVLDASGVALAAAKALDGRTQQQAQSLQSLRDENSALKTEVARLQERLSALEAAVASLTSGSRR